MDFINDKPIYFICHIHFFQNFHKTCTLHKFFRCDIYNFVIELLDLTIYKRIIIRGAGESARRYSKILDKIEIILNKWEKRHDNNSDTFISDCSDLKSQTFSSSSRYQRKCISFWFCAIYDFSLVLSETIKPKYFFVNKCDFIIPQKRFLPFGNSFILQSYYKVIIFETFVQNGGEFFLNFLSLRF